MSGGGGSGAVVIPIVTGGTVTSFFVVRGGSGYSSGSPPTISVWGTGVSGTQVTMIHNFQHISNPNIWAPDVSIFMVNGTGSAPANCNPWAVSPDVLRGNAPVLSIDRTQTLATDDNVLAYLTSPNGNTPGLLRYMDVASGYQNMGNFVDPADISVLPATQPWGQNNTRTVNFQFARFVNTDPSSSTYAWSSTKLYGNQAWAISGVDPTFTNYGGGSQPSGTPYFALPTADNGKFAGNGSGAGHYVVVELRSTTAHGMRTGDTMIFGGSTSIPVTNLAGGFNPDQDGGDQLVVWVTGPNTVVALFFTGQSSGASNPQAVNSTTEVAINWHAALVVPNGTGCVPFEYTAAMVTQLGNTGLWHNIPAAASDALIQLQAQKIAANIGPNNIVYLEVGNENWNNTNGQNWYTVPLNNVLAYMPAGTVVFGNMVATGAGPGNNGGIQALITAHAQDVFVAEWAALGMATSRIKRILGSWWVQSGFTQQGLAVAQQWGCTPFDYVNVAPYLYNTLDQSIGAASAPAGSNVGGAQSMPIDCMNEIFRFRMAYSQTNWSVWASHAQYLQAYGQPMAPTTFANSGGSTGHLTAGSYKAYFTFVDSSLRETTVGLSQTGSLAISTGNTPTLAMPPWPAWAASLNIYLLPPGGPSILLYVNIPRSQYGPGNTYPVGAAIPLSAALTGSTSPPTTNQAAANSPPPVLCTYEGGASQIASAVAPLFDQMCHDCLAHPSARDLIYGWYWACQQGCPTVPGGGCGLGVYYQMYNNISYPDIWEMAYGSSQPAGDGVSLVYGGASSFSFPANKFATIQGGFPADGHDHNEFNAAPALMGWRDWNQAVAPPIPAPAARARRWFQGLRRPVLRLGR